MTTKPKLTENTIPESSILDPDTDSLVGPEVRDADDPDALDGPAGIEDLADIEDLDELDGDEALVGDDDEELDIDAIDGEDALDDVLDETEDEAVLDVVAVEPEARPRKVAAPAEGAAEVETDDDELLADEVEASLDVILAERLRGEDSEADEELDDEEDDAPNQLATVIPVRQPDEFLCQSCFLLKPPGQLADPDHQLCRDCA